MTASFAMKPNLKLLMMLAYAMLCTASIVPRRIRSSDITPYLHSLGIPLAVRQDASCLSEEECGEGNLCAQLVGEPFCKSDCEGFCIPEEARDFICNCDLPCKMGVCTDPLPGDEQPDNGLCSSDKDTKAFKCAGKKEDNVDVGEVKTEEEEKKPGVNDEKKDPAEPNDPEIEQKPDEDKSDDEGSDDDDTEAGAEDVTGESDSGTGEEEEEVDTPGKTSEATKPGKKEEENSSEVPDSGTESRPEPGKSEQAPSTSETTEKPSPNAETPSPQVEPGTSETTEEENSGVCISREHLRHVHASRLVFRKDVLAHVLCDTSGSCATAGHMVLFRGRGMMMRRYCEQVGCVKRVMWVNSPMYETGLRIESRSSDLSFTALAARFGTVAEEVVLGTAVRFGM